MPSQVESLLLHCTLQWKMPGEVSKSVPATTPSKTAFVET
jgi:hypothetical protein